MQQKFNYGLFNPCEAGTARLSVSTNSCNDSQRPVTNMSWAPVPTRWARWKDLFPHHNQLVSYPNMVQDDIYGTNIGHLERVGSVAGAHNGAELAKTRLRSSPPPHFSALHIGGSDNRPPRAARVLDAGVDRSL